MRADTERLIVTVDQVLRAAETKQSNQKHWSEVSLGELVIECTEEARKRYRLEPEQLEVTAPSGDVGDVSIMGDSEELRVAITNLLDNAVKYSPQGPKISVAVRLLGEQVVVAVADQGLGIPPSDLKRVFKRFYRGTRKRSRIKGTGLGLFIVDSIVRKHRGSAIAESAGEGRGTTISLRLPRYSGR
jgi:two-component system sensor histidine kinase SenX3